MQIVKKLVTKPDNCTEFQLHKSQLQLSQQSFKSKIYDFTEYKIKKLIKETYDMDRKILLTDLLTKYCSGLVAIAWENGSKPVYVIVTRDNRF